MDAYGTVHCASLISTQNLDKWAFFVYNYTVLYCFESVIFERGRICGDVFACFGGNRTFVCDQPSFAVLCTACSFADCDRFAAFDGVLCPSRKALEQIYPSSSKTRGKKIPRTGCTERDHLPPADAAVSCGGVPPDGADRSGARKQT